MALRHCIHHGMAELATDLTNLFFGSLNSSSYELHGVDANLNIVGYKIYDYFAFVCNFYSTKRGSSRRPCPHSS